MISNSLNPQVCKLQVFGKEIDVKMRICFWVGLIHFLAIVFICSAMRTGFIESFNIHTKGGSIRSDDGETGIYFSWSMVTNPGEGERFKKRIDHQPVEFESDPDRNGKAISVKII